MNFAFQADQVNPANFRGVAVGDHERRNVLHNLRTSARDSEPPEPAKLMDRGEPANDGVIAHFNVASQRAVV